VENEVDERIALSQTTTANRAFFRMCGNLTFGSVDDPREMQLEQGLAHCFEMREKQRHLIAQVNELMSNQR
jgi:hypothetical protein